MAMSIRRGQMPTVEPNSGSVTGYRPSMAAPASAPAADFASNYRGSGGSPGYDTGPTPEMMAQYKGPAYQGQPASAAPAAGEPLDIQTWVNHTFPKGTRVRKSEAYRMYQQYVDGWQRGNTMTPYQQQSLSLDRQRLEQSDQITPYQRESLDLRREAIDQRNQPRPMNEYEQALMRYKSDELGHRKAELAHRVEQFNAEHGQNANVPVEQWGTDQLLRAFSQVGDEEYLPDLDPEMAAFQKRLKQELMKRAGGSPATTSVQETPTTAATPSGGDALVKAIVNMPDGSRQYAEGTKAELDAQYPGWEPAQ